MSVVYLTTWYEEKSPSRAVELALCLWKTLESGEVDHVHLLAEAEPPFTHEKLSWGMAESRPTYNDFFLRANELGKPGDVLIISNTDLYPEKGTREKLNYLEGNQCFALSRWDEAKDGTIKHFNRVDSQDVWAFRYPINMTIKGDFPLGIPGCDNRIAYEIGQVGYELSNPSKTIVFRHVHNSNVRSYKPGKDSVPPPYLRITPTILAPAKVCSTSALSGVLHVGFSQPPLERAFAAEYENYKFIRWTDYQKRPTELMKLMYEEWLTGRYQMVFFHVQTPDIIDPEVIRAMKDEGIVQNPLFINWTGDVRTPLPPW